ADWIGEEPAMKAFRRHASWYTKGFRGSAKARFAFMQVNTLTELQQVINTLDQSEPFPPGAMRVVRGKSGGTQVVSLPEHYLENREDETPPEEEFFVEGG